MKKRIFISGLIVTGAVLTACTQPPVSSGSSNAIPSSTQNSTSDSSGVASSSESQLSGSVESSSLSSSQTNNNLQFYESLSDVPWAILDYTHDKNGLSKDGVQWYAAPGNQKIGDIAFSNEQFLFVQIFFPTNDKLKSANGEWYKPLALFLSFSYDSW